ncbi:MAG: hypothetical protein IJN63_09515 [Clostridia bacterium]|nr:hypothetical protein [Clostridia bacterium]
MAYDPYKAAAQIVRNKGKWGTAVASGKSGDEYHERALYYYDELRNNGYSEIADKLEQSDYGEALEYLDALEKNEGEYDEAKELASASAKKSALDQRRTELYDSLRAKYGELYDEAKDGELSEGSEAVLGRFRNMGERAAENAVASVASSNGGNMDSYAAANAHRQLSDYLTAGEEAAQKAEGERVGRLLSILDGMYVSQSGLISDADNSAEASAGLAYDVYSAKLRDETEKRKEALQKELAEKEMSGPWDEIYPNDYYVDRYEKYYNALLNIYPDFAEEITDIFHFLG